MPSKGRQGTSRYVFCLSRGFHDTADCKSIIQLIFNFNLDEIIFEKDVFVMQKPIA